MGTRIGNTWRPPDWVSPPITGRAVRRTSAKLAGSRRAGPGAPTAIEVSRTTTPDGAARAMLTHPGRVASRRDALWWNVARSWRSRLWAVPRVCSTRVAPMSSRSTALTSARGLDPPPLHRGALLPVVGDDHGDREHHRRHEQADDHAEEVRRDLDGATRWRPGRVTRASRVARRARHGTGAPRHNARLSVMAWPPSMPEVAFACKRPDGLPLPVRRGPR
jgi:hypothetical protein